jgi:serine/threonine protein kinase
MIGERIPLTQFGWDGCYADFTQTIPSSITNHLPTWRHLNILRPPESYGSRMLQFPYRFLVDKDGHPYLPAIQIAADPIAEGTYGSVYKAQRAIYRPIQGDEKRLQRTEDFTEIVSKENTIELVGKERLAPHKEREEYWSEEIQAVLFEATLHALVYHTLQKHGHGSAVPALYDVFGSADTKQPTSPLHIRSVYIQMEFIEGETLHNYLHTAFPTTTNPKQLAANDQLLLDILIQLAFYLDILQTDLRFNHRDLKVNNVIRRSGTPHRVLKHTDLRQPWDCRNDLVMIDFGFSCVACGPQDVKSLIQAGSWFRQDHDCMKRGRDLALFIFCLQSCYPLQGRITRGLWDILVGAMIPVGPNIPPASAAATTSLLETGINGGFVFDAAIYRYLRADGMDVPECAPRRLMKKLSAFVAA